MIRRLLLVQSALSLAFLFPAIAAPTPLDGFLGHFEGQWRINGTTLGKQTVTGAEVQSEFNGKFFELHIKDPLGHDKYEARVFFGSDDKGGVIVHWLDGTGGETSKTLGIGRIEGDLMTLVFPYPDGIFRDRLTYDSGHDRWRLLIEMGPTDHPKVFSDWLFERPS